ncbi:MAG: tRNA 2-thiouridine(34) synthase MnmA [Candidatus Liptonbacteria bacterium]|nr:tRNA 2-thiouridine(34) synthase MnmA [Candidatus Liptonbacteria bacterium]
MKRVFVGMSGGVDSSVAAYLLKQRGYDVTGVFIRSYNLDGCAERDAEDARRTAEAIGIPFYVFDLEREYRTHVVDYMVDGYRNGITPNPDVMCNKHVKFGAFLEKAVALGADFIATGHYVRKIPNSKRQIPNTYGLAIAKDSEKDQSYFLWTLGQDQLKRCLFPIGEYTKPQVRAIARRACLPTAGKKDSQGICFLGKVSIGDFLKERIPSAPGVVITTDGENIGTHDGAFQYTIGQRHLGIPLKTGSRPHYIVRKDVKTNTVVMAAEDDRTLYISAVTLGDINLPGYVWDNLRAMRLYARIRYRQPLVRVTAEKGNHIRFSRPQKFVAPGQSAVLYTKSFLAPARMIGGGIIDS